jgi:hypothetical protein
MADHDELLKILNARGKEFLDSFSLPEPSAKKRRITQESASEDEYDTWDSNLDSDGTDDEFHSLDDDVSEGMKFSRMSANLTHFSSNKGTTRITRAERQLLFSRIPLTNDRMSRSIKPRRKRSW